MKKESYDSQSEEYFFDYLPDEVFNSLSEKERKHYREYRRYHHLLFKSNEKIDSYKREIDRLKNLIKEERFKLKGGTKIEDGEEEEYDGWEYQLKYHYDHVSHLDKLLRMRVNVEVRNRSSRSFKVRSGESDQYSFERISKTYKGEPLTKRVYLYGRVDSVISKYRLNFYFGPLELVRDKLVVVFGESILEESLNGLRWKLIQLLTQFTRYNVFHSGWTKLESQTLNLDTIIDWVTKCDQNSIDRSVWG